MVTCEGPKKESEKHAPYRGNAGLSCVDDTDTIPAGLTPIKVNGMVCYTNGKEKTGTAWYSDGSRQDHRAGAGIKCGQLEIIARVTGLPTSYSAKLQGAAIVCCLACPGDELVIDNKAVVEYRSVLPHKECSDSDLRKVIEVHQEEKPLRWRWIPSHGTIKHYHTAEEKRDIQCSDAVNKLAKMATRLPLHESPEGGVDRIMICNGVVPTLAKKWIMEYHHEAT